MNRSFNRLDTYEGKEATRLKGELDEYDANVVIDLHVTKASMPPSVIVTDLKRLEIAKILGISKAIYMTDKFANGGSLIENIENSISIELFADTSAVKVGKKIIDNVLSGRKDVKEFDVFTVERKIKDIPVSRIKNFEILLNGKYPVFYENKSYVKNSGVYYLGCSFEIKLIV